MFYSYVMGIDLANLNLTEGKFNIKKDGNNYMVSFNNDSVIEWEKLIFSNLPIGYWNEYLMENDIVVFMFHLPNEFRKYIVSDYKNDEVLRLCNKLSGGDFRTIKTMLKSNLFYYNKIK